MGVVLLVRHGQASFGADDYDVLSETGWTQSRLLGEHLAARGVVPDVVVRGRMRRHRETADGMLAAAGWSVPVEEDSGWDEFDHLGVVAAHPEVPDPGDRADRADPTESRRDFQRLFEAATRRWTSGDHEQDYSEPFASFRWRVLGALTRASVRAGPGGTVAVITSGGPIGVVAGHLVAPSTTAEPDSRAAEAGRAVPRADEVAAELWARFNAVVVNSSFTRLVVGSTGPRLLTFNEHPHLEGDHLTYR
jgi:broad specificity phosphatase PhoE